MSNKNKHKKRKQNNRKNQSVELLGNNSYKRKQLLIGIGILSIIAITIFCIMLPGIMNEQDDVVDNNKQEIQSTITIKTIGEPINVDDVAYNIWFNIVTDGTKGDITITPSHGYVLQYNKEDGSVSNKPVNVISSDEIDKYDYIWCIDKESEFMLCKNNIVIENKTIKKETNLFILCKDTAITFLTESGYENVKNNWDKIINDEYEGKLDE